MPDETVVSVRGLVVRHDERDVVDRLDLNVSRGAVVGLIGPDGAGKTSTLRVIAGLQQPSSGTVEVLGSDAWTQRRQLHHSLGYLAQRFALYGDLTVDENIRFFSQLLGVREWRTRRDRLLDRLGLAPFRSRQADRLSGGMRQKLALACSFMHSPEILVLDEPTTGVDPVTRREFWRLLGELVAEGVTLILATPYLDEAERCSRVVLMHLGHALSEGPPAKVRSQLPGTVIEVAAEPPAVVARALASLPGAADVQPFAAHFHVRLESDDGVERVRSTLDRAGATVHDVREIPASLEDTFLYLTRTQQPQSAPGIL